MRIYLIVDDLISGSIEDKIKGIYSCYSCAYDLIQEWNKNFRIVELIAWPCKNKRTHPIRNMEHIMKRKKK